MAEKSVLISLFQTHEKVLFQVLGVRALKDISTGEEFTVNYKYDVMDSPEWFQQLYLDI